MSTSLFQRIESIVSIAFEQLSLNLTISQKSGLWHSPPRLEYQGNSLQVKNSYEEKKETSKRKNWDAIMSYERKIEVGGRIFELNNI